MASFIPFHAYEASAGSGKTFSLVVRYLSLLFMGEDADKILALTFTNKAANEMQERIIETLKYLEERGELQVISDVTGMSDSQLLSLRKKVLDRFLNADAKVMTIDKFFSKILRKFSLHAGLMPDFSTYESQHEIKVMSRFLSLVDVQGKEEALITLSLSASKRLSDIFSLLDELYAKSKELVHLTFEPQPYTQYEAEALAAASELKAIVGATKVSNRGRTAMEFDSIDALIAKSWIGKETLEYWDYKKVFDPQMDTLLHRIQKALASYMQAKEQHFLYALFSLLDTYVEAKRRVAKEDGELSFDDITALVFYLLKERIDSEFLYFRLDSRISHLLLDEFQDTSVIQFEILRPIIEELLSGSGVDEQRSFFLVGDVKQSIYRFRGGSKELFHTVTSAYDLQVDQLTVNYRSHQNVVEFVNDVFRDKIAGYADQHVKADAQEGSVEIIEDDELLEAMQQKAEALIQLGAEPNEIAILTATNADGSAVEALLKSSGIEVVTEVTSRLTHQRSVRALIEYLKYSYFNKALYARNFFALIEREPTKLERCNIDTTDLVSEVKKVIETYGLYDGDLNLLRFMEQLAHYSDIEQFLFEYERLDTKAASADMSGVRVLTVHKSKGLEFKHVIVLDRLGRPKADTAPIIYEYDGIQLQHLFLRMKNRALLDDAYAQALEKEKKLSDEDKLNALYVAFTRAKENLIIVQKSKSSTFDRLDLLPHRRGETVIARQARQAEKTHASLDYRPLVYGTQKEILESEKTEDRDHQAIEFGLGLHYTLEMMERFDSAALKIAMVGTQNRFGAVLDAAALQSIEKRIIRLLEDAQFSRLSSGEIFKEQPLSYKNELRYLDLLIKHEEHWTVIDYKSAMSHTDEYLTQVGFYKKAVAEITGEKSEAYLCYLLEDEVKWVEV